MLKIKLIYIICFFLSVYISQGQDKFEWRGNGRTGIYNETGLLEKWPENGPELIWSTDSLPDGFSSVAISEKAIFTTGFVDSSDIVIALDKNGKELWRTIYGRAWDGSFPNSRCTPTFDHGKLYLSSGKGDLACVDALNGKIIWQWQAGQEFGLSPGRWGFAESLVVDENNVYFTTGGNVTNTIALDKKSGNIVWKSKSLNDIASYTSPLVVNYKNKKIIVSVTQNYIFGFDPNSGDILWKFDFGSYAGGEGKRNNHTNTPVFDNGCIYLASGYDHSGVKLKLAGDLKSVSLQWADTILDTHHGGNVKVGNYIYGSTWTHNSMGKWACIDWETGKLMYHTEWINKGSVISANGMLYCTEEKTGNIALVKADPNEFKIISSFKITKGIGPFWAHPVIHNGVLYIRHGKALMAYKIK
ncbi:MAG: PQQ-binding-like beta-propeller repeat protein [Bacteroidales bacterium]